MRKLLLFIFLSIFSLSSVNAEVEDTSIIDELKNEEIKEIGVDFNLKSFESCKELEDVMQDYIKEYWKVNKDKYNYPVRGLIMEDSVNSLDFAESSVQTKSVSSESGMGGGTGDDFSKTNVQVEGVSEADIIKTDGKYIYYYNSKGDYKESKYVYIIDASNSSDLELVKKIKVPSFFNGVQLYIGENRLSIIASGYSNSTYKGYWINRNSKTYTIIYDTSDIEKPVLKKLYINDGNLSKSRKIGKYLYIVSNNHFNIPYHTFKDEDDISIEFNKILPKKIDISKTQKENNQNLKLSGKTYPFNLKSGNIAKCNEIEYVLPDSETLKKYSFNPSYNIVSIIDTEDTENEVKTKVIAGNSAEIYMSLDNLYITDRMYSSYNYKCPANARCIMPFYWGGTTNTLVHKLNIDGNSLKYQTSNIVPGMPLNQYSMDQKDDYFRIITQTDNWGLEREQFTGLYILDKNLEKYSSLEGLGEGERFQSSRFMGDKLFLVTFKQVDPLFAIDLADQKNPKILGELKIPGYSTYLHPYDNKHLIGIGYDTYENEWGGTRNSGVKLDLYEINYDKKCGDSNLSLDEQKKCNSGDYKGIIVKQKYTQTFGDSGSYSEALNNPRMFMWNSNKNLLLLPATIYLNETKDSYKHIDFFNGLIALEIDKDSGIEEKYKITHIDKKLAEEKRMQECKKYLDKKKESEECKTLLDGSKYCPGSSSNYYIPEYCYADSPLGAYIASRNWEFRDNFVKRALWIGDKSFAISDAKITSHDLDDGDKDGEVEMK